MEIQLLRDPEIFPTNEILKNILGDIYSTFESMMETIESPEFGLSHEWNYYKDGKSWLCKVYVKKKTTFWLSVWEGYYKIAFYFTEKHLEGIAALDIDEKIKEDFCKTKSIGRLLPMLFNISNKEQLIDLLKVIDFKRKLN